MIGAEGPLESSFDPRQNSLNFLRLVLATAVIVSHAWPLGGFGEDPHWGSMDVGDWAVGGFFAISGWLIMASRLKVTPREFAIRRFRRIYPGFIVCLFVVAFVFAPVSVALGSSGYSPYEGMLYVLRNSLFVIGKTGIGHTLDEVPFPHVWNGVLWTLFYEVLCYLVVGLAVGVIERRFLNFAVSAIWCSAVVVTWFTTLAVVQVPGTIEHAARLSTFFFAGSLLYLNRSRVASGVGIALVALSLIVVSMATSTGAYIGGLPIAYLCIWLGAKLPFQRVGRVNDISYGVYIYAFPVQQTLALIGVNKLGLLPYVLASIAITLPFAAASWFLVEKRALRRKRRQMLSGAVAG